ncbi:MAG: hypothetical protein Tsb0016_23000 [Sphingomonadales bacterium]
MSLGRRAALAAALAVAAPALALAADLLDGVRLYEQGDYAGAIEIWQPLAEQNDPNALFNMGQVYRLGRGVETDPARAREFYERAAVQGHIAAQGYLGTLLYFGDESLRDVDAAIQWWRRAASHGDAGSQYMLGVLYFNGDHVERDWVQAYAWMYLAVGNGLREAKDAEASMLAHLSAEQIAEGKALAPGLVTAATPAAPPVPSASLEAANPVAANQQTAASQPPSPDTEPPTPAPPAPEPAEATAAAPQAEMEGWLLQLASLSNQAQAQATQERLWQRHGEVLGAIGYRLVEADLGDKGQFVRVMAGPVADLDGAKALCARLREAGQGCFVRRAP